MSRKISRRKFLRDSAVVAAGMVAVACKAPAPTAAPTVKPVDTAVPATKPAASAVPATAVPATKPPATAAPAALKEAPALADLVKAGKLPPVQDRLPKVPCVVNEFPASVFKAEVGRYGGQMRFGTTDPATDAELFCACNEPLVNIPGIVLPGKILQEVTPNVAEAFKVSADQKEFTFTLRQGMKWSDGQPVTTEDVRFCLEDVYLNKEYTSNLPAWLRTENAPTGEPFKYEIVDQYTFKISFSKPYGGFLAQLAVAGWRGYESIMKPAHYLKQFHKKYADPAKLEAAIKAEKVETWVQLFSRMDCVSNAGIYKKQAIGFPSLQPWVQAEESQDRKTFARNPYYFKVDAAGQQLPYIDKLVSRIFSNPESFGMAMIAGEIDCTYRFATLAKMPLYKENEKAGFKAQLVTDHTNTSLVHLNLTHTDPNWRKAVQDKRFRQALNMAIDRKELIDAVYLSYAELPTIVPSEFNLQKANQLLDEMGLNKRDGEGYRLGFDGKTLEMPFEISNSDPNLALIGQIVVENWKKAGLKTTMKVIEQNLWAQRNGANELRATVYWAPTALWFQGNYGQGQFAPLWNRWWTTGGKDGEEPPAEMKAFLAKMDQRMTVPMDQISKVIDELRKLMYDDIWCMVAVEKNKQALITNAKFGNVPTSQDVIGIVVDFGGEQFYMKS